MAFRLHAVAPPLNAYVDFLYLTDGPMPFRRDCILPMPAIDLKFNLGERWQVRQPDDDRLVTVCDHSWCLGIWSRLHVVEWPATVEFLGVSFKPGGACAFLGVSLAEMRDSVVPLDAIWGRFAEEARERLGMETSAEARLALLETLLLQRLRDRPASAPMVDFAVAQIAGRHGALRIDGLCDQIGVSHKHLISLFRQIVGCTPKELARLHRFAHAVHSLDPARPVRWTSIAHEADYYDQAHFSHEFAGYTGMSPSAYLELRQRARAEEPDGALSFVVVPAG